MKIVFVSHPCPVLLNGDEPWSPVRTNIWPQSQLTLAASVQEYFDVELLDLRSIADPNKWRSELGGEYLHPLEYGGLSLTRHLIGDYRERIFNCFADAYVLTANFTAEANSVAEIIRTIKQMHPQAIVLVGGRDASAPERHSFYFSAGADFIGVGDGDVSLPKFLSEFDGSQKTGSRIIQGGIPCDFKLKQLNFNLKGLDRVRYKESGGGPILKSILAEKEFAAYFETSRGCVRECAYCTEAKTSRWNEPVAEVKKRIDQYVKAGCRLFMISDDNLLLRKPAEIIEIFIHLRESNVAWEFPVGLESQLLARRTGIIKEKLFDALFWNSGKTIGEIFSGAQRLLLPLEDALLRKSKLLKLSQIHDGAAGLIERLLEGNIPFLNIAIMIGDPSETQEDRAVLEDNMEKIHSSVNKSNTNVNFSIFCTSPLPGTPFGFEMIANGCVAYPIKKAPEFWTVYTSVISGDVFSAAETTRYRRYLLERFNMSQREGKVSPGA